MNRFITTVITLLAVIGSAVAQPSGVKNAAKSAFRLTAYNAEGKVIATSVGVFASADGEAVGAWSTLAQAASADVTDFSGKTYRVKSIIGANELYDVCHFRVDVSKTQCAVMGQEALKAGGKVWLVGAAEPKKVAADEYAIQREETFMDKYAYYVFAYNPKSALPGSPFVTADGQVVGLYQVSESSLGSSAVDARFAAQLSAAPLDVSNSMYAKTGIRLLMPLDHKDALLMVMLSSELRDSAKYAGYVDDYIAAFPHEVDGYSTRAVAKVGYADYAGADADMQTALRVATNKAEAHSEYARVIYQKVLYSGDSVYASWNLDKALKEAQMACSIDNQPGYRHRMAQILFSKGQYDEAYGIFSSLPAEGMRTSEVFFEAAQCKTQLGAPNDELLALLDSAVAACKRPLDNTSAPYILSRGQMYNTMGEYKKAIADFNVYDTLMFGRANAEFYFTRYQCEVKARQYQPALNDIAHAAYIGGDYTPFYLAEMASLQLRVNMLDDAVKSADLCLSIQPDNTDALVIKGVALANLKRKDEAVKCLQRAKELGDSRADDYIKKYK